MIRVLLIIIFTLAISLTANNLRVWAQEGHVHHGHETESAGQSEVSVLGNVVGVESNKLKIQCPVMKTWFVPDEKSDKIVYKDKTYYFCCPGCKPQFEKEPGKYVKE